MSLQCPLYPKADTAPERQETILGPLEILDLGKLEGRMVGLLPRRGSVQ